ncbi:MAG: ABC transporter substrate-binding protein [Cardiobacteriaceae bacterium]|nr:ABC transporter substrate-binding protein [Cardiobacteriaceae bacterium]
MKHLFLALLLLSSFARAADKIEILQSWFTNPVDAQLVIALKKGYFAEENLDVTLIEPSDPSLPPKLVAAGKSDVAVTYQPALQIDVAAGLPLTRVSTLIAAPLNSLMVREDSGIKTLADLKGKKVGYSVSGFEDAQLAAMLGSAGLTLADVEVVNINWAITTALLTRQVDAVIGAYRNFEFYQMAMENTPARLFFPEEHGVPTHDELILVVNNSRRDDPVFRRLNHALEKASLYIVNHPEDAWQLFTSYKEGLDDELNRKAWNDIIPRLALRPAALDGQRYQRLADFLLEKGVIDKALPPVAEYAIEP